MAFEIIKDIVEAEKQAENIKTKALADADAIKELALTKSKEIIAEGKKQAKIDGEKMVKEAIASSVPKKDEILADAKNKCSEIIKSAEQQKEKAAKAVVGKVVGNDGNC